MNDSKLSDLGAVPEVTGASLLYLVQALQSYRTSVDALSTYVLDGSYNANLAFDGTTLNLNTLVVSGDTPSTSTSTGCGVFSGGVGIGGALNVGSTVTIGAYTLPATDGTANQVLKTDGLGTLTWQADANITAHGSLTGLGNDDHTQYHTDARALTWLNSAGATGATDGHVATASSDGITWANPAMVTAYTGADAAGVGANILSSGLSRIWNNTTTGKSYLLTNYSGTYRAVELTNV